MAQTKQDNSTSASTWQERFENRKIKQRQMFEDAAKYYDIMYAVQNTQKISPWKAKVYVPILASKAWDLIARMSDVIPLFDVTIKNELDLDDSTGNFQLAQGVQEREDRIAAKLQYDYLNAHDEPMKLKVFDPLVDAVVAGTGYAYAPWCAHEDVQRARPYDELGTMDNTKTVTKTTQTGYNGFEPINFFNVFPGDGPNWFKIPYLIVRGYSTKVDMEKSGLYENLDQCDTGPRQPVDEFTLYNQSRDRVLNELDMVAMDDTVDMITYYECYERTADGLTLTTYAEGLANEAPEGGLEEDNHPWVEIRSTTVPYWHNIYPVVPFYCRRKSFSPFGESLFENNRTLQSATNDLFNHYLDNWNLSIDSMLMYEDGTLTNDFIIEPGGEITFTGEAPKQFKFPEPNPTQLSTVMNVLEKGIDTATFSPYAAGTPNDPADKTRGTAYGVKTITEAATTKIGFFRDNFKQSMKIVGRIWLSNLQQFADNPSEIRRIQNGRVVPDVVMPSDYQGEIDLDIDDDSMTPLSKQDRIDANDRFIQNLMLLQKVGIQQAEVFKSPSDIPRYNLLEIAEDVAELYSKRNFNRYLLPSNVPQQGSDQGNFRDTPQGVALDGIAKKIDKMEPDIQAQVEEVAGLHSSAMHPQSTVTNAMDHATKQAQMENPQGGLDGSGPAQQPNAGGKPAPQAGATA